ncbi:phage head-tail joining protein [Rhodospira trueperi]|uniref:GpW protein n=1 Tax=Rhodospira trueperi TaxID=69960 RepID=A0A1G7BF43_9PROT|nr:hypothetical protein [Rhodospira trueperi]SDE25708.1 hypothetical protein SAMN05421720_10510 [Rhodospira trueperi]
MADLATLIARRDALEGQMAAGVLTVEHDGKRVTYRNMAEMEAALSRLNRAIASASGTARVYTVRISTTKGL